MEIGKFPFYPDTQFPFPETHGCEQFHGYHFPQSTPHPASRKILWKCETGYITPLPIIPRMSLYILTPAARSHTL